VAIWGSGMGVCIAANSVPGVRACLIHECFSAHQGVEDDDMNVICLGGYRRGECRRVGIGPGISAGTIQRCRASPASSR
jgi:ribose 5-phosphate isomerase RpiB